MNVCWCCFMVSHKCNPHLNEITPGERWRRFRRCFFFLLQWFLDVFLCFPNPPHHSCCLAFSLVLFLPPSFIDSNDWFAYISLCRPHKSKEMWCWICVNKSSIALGGCGSEDIAGCLVTEGLAIQIPHPASPSLCPLARHMYNSSPYIGVCDWLNKKQL